MPVQDVHVIINLVKPAALIGLGRILILANKPGESTFKSYTDLDSIKADYADTTNAYKKASAIFAQGSNRPDLIYIANYDPAADGDETPGYKLTEAITAYAEKDWEFLILADAEQEDKVAAAPAVEALGIKFLVVKIEDEASRAAFKTYDRTIVFYHPVADEHPDAALVGACGSQTVGSITWKFKTLLGITPQDFTTAQVQAIHGDGAIAYVTKAGIPQTSEGIVGSGEYIDVIHSKDWIKVNMEHSIQVALSNAKKISFDNTGIGILEGQVTNVLQQAFTNGIIATDADGQPIYTITAKTRDEVDGTDIASRTYNGLSFSFELAGAIHQATITGEISEGSSGSSSSGSGSTTTP
ncbi:DUF3383 domain-containing protein [Sporolactobacillus shoreicorticis]|uniref:DUF3383 family protein n=1 Tax=Sporolactobacillus shoreicorticis TaxID=1923877 RepID=A0ABW5S8I4_9BACL|nr:DUF3383 family protein [Sporolactobacillus shoreicorticis]MCO7127815.1 DUF3383 domain-containing protein [Sporolactobacillus shoreicorticis]